MNEIICPLCGTLMSEDGDYYLCNGNKYHAILIEKEWIPYKNGDKDDAWLRHRMKIRFGKKLHSRQAN